jgi:hypothetical protein
MPAELIFAEEEERSKKKKKKKENQLSRGNHSSFRLQAPGLPGLL